MAVGTALRLPLLLLAAVCVSQARARAGASAQDVAKLLVDEGLHEYVSAFVGSEVDGDAFAELTRDDLSRYGVENPLHREKVRCGAVRWRWRWRRWR